MPYEPVIGFEIHAQVKTRSKMFCGCPNRFGAEPNAQACPVCLGYPGVLPVINREAIHLALRAALAFGSEVQPFAQFARKNYWYPDLPKNYQISQYESPLALGGHADIEVNDETKRVRLVRVHIEEDAGKLVHGEEGGAPSDASLFDANRCGTPLLEIVSEPDLRSAEEAHAYMTAMRQILVYLDVSDGKMEEGSLRCEPNISVRPVGSEELGTKTEIKNLNSFRFAQRAIEAEIARQIGHLEAGQPVVQETFLWDVANERTVSMRSKEFAHDYRYFPEPDLVPLRLERAWIDEIRRELPELPAERRARFGDDYGLSDYDAGVLTAERDLADYFEATVAAGAPPKAAANWVMGDVLRILNDQHISASELSVPPSHLAELLGLVEEGTISGTMAKTVFEKMLQSGEPPRQIVEAEGLVQISDTDRLEVIAREIIERSPGEVARYRAGRVQLLGWFVGQLMRETKGKADPRLANEIFGRALADVGEPQSNEAGCPHMRRRGRANRALVGVLGLAALLGAGSAEAASSARAANPKVGTRGLRFPQDWDVRSRERPRRGFHCGHRRPQYSHL